jgi:heat shock 70kDa protein 1/2/6/8
VNSTNGDTHLGGRDFDKLLVDYAANDFYEATGKDPRSDPKALHKLTMECEKAKISLSTCSSVEVDICVMKEEHSIRFLRATFEDLVRPWLEKAMNLVTETLKDAGVPKDEVDEIVLVGGSSRIPLVSELLEDYFGKVPSQTVDPDEVVAQGAAIAATVGRTNHDIMISDVTPLSLGVAAYINNVRTFRPIIPRHTQVPTAEGAWSREFTTHVDDQTNAKFEVRLLYCLRIAIHCAIADYVTADLRGGRPGPGEQPHLGQSAFGEHPEGKAGGPKAEGVHARGCLKHAACSSQGREHGRDCHCVHREEGCAHTGGGEGEDGGGGRVSTGQFG